MAGPYVGVLSLNRSQNVRLGNAQTAAKTNPVPGDLDRFLQTNPQTGNTISVYYADLSDPTVRRDLQRHSAIGSLLVVVPLTQTPSDPVVANGGLVTAGSGLNVNVSAGLLKNRATATTVDGASATNDTLTDTTSAGQSIVYLVTWDNTTGAVGLTAGTAATTGTQVAPATPTGKTPLATVLFAHGASAPGTITDVRPLA